MDQNYFVRCNSYLTVYIAEDVGTALTSSPTERKVELMFASEQAYRDAFTNLFDNGDFACLQIPMSYDIGIEIPLDKKTITKRAHRRNVAVQYWTINDVDEMRYLIEMGVDCIMTDDPVLLSEVLEEYR
jgi:glycerophosphoryl diester phosphodiesterase